ncbi:hypothetical protein EC991_006735 [Linnemannia zychae]|nr:hypothetical protein EC991_006735 [Linnemannia zychae]
MQIPPTRVKSTKDRAIARDQRRHSSEDGRPCATGTTSSPPLNNRPSSSPPASFDKYAIPPKCRMVFHMRDEVPRPREEDKTGLSENRFYQYRPQLQPRGRIHTQSPSSSSSSSADKSQDEGSSLSTPISSIPVKKPNTGKCAKMVSFKEPEPWRDVTPPPPPFVVQNEKRDRQEAKQIRILFTRLDIPTITVTEPNQQKQQQQMREISSSALTPTVRRPTSEPILSNGSTVLSSSSSSSLRHVQAATRASTSTPPPTESSSPNQQQPFSSAMGGRHRRNMSMPIQFVSSPSPLTAAGSNVPGRMQAGQGGAMIVEPRTTATTKSGNRLLRLWKSATQKYSSHYSHHHSGHHLHGAANGVGCLGGKGSDLEPLVSMARE